jgi:DUF438 domain-containing protein
MRLNERFFAFAATTEGRHLREVHDRRSVRAVGSSIQWTRDGQSLSAELR